MVRWPPMHALSSASQHSAGQLSSALSHSTGPSPSGSVHTLPICMRCTLSYTQLDPGVCGLQIPHDRPPCFLPNRFGTARALTASVLAAVHRLLSGSVAQGTAFTTNAHSRRKTHVARSANLPDVPPSNPERADRACAPAGSRASASPGRCVNTCRWHEVMPTDVSAPRLSSTICCGPLSTTRVRCYYLRVVSSSFPRR